jgi:hypothetical protein
MPRRRCKRLTDELVGAFRVRGAGSSAARRKFCEGAGVTRFQILPGVGCEAVDVHLRCCAATLDIVRVKVRSDRMAADPPRKS